MQAKNELLIFAGAAIIADSVSFYLLYNKMNKLRVKAGLPESSRTINNLNKIALISGLLAGAGCIYYGLKK